MTKRCNPWRIVTTSALRISIYLALLLYFLISLLFIQLYLIFTFIYLSFAIEPHLFLTSNILDPLGIQFVVTWSVWMGLCLSTLVLYVLFSCGQVDDDVQVHSEYSHLVMDTLSLIYVLALGSAIFYIFGGNCTHGHLVLIHTHMCGLWGLQCPLSIIFSILP